MSLVSVYIREDIRIGGPEELASTRAGRPVNIIID